MKVTGISMVRDEADVVQLSLLHHLAIGCDGILVVDNGSTDGTLEILRRLARDHPVRWLREDGPYRQSETMTALAQEAARDGAAWIVPFDADEFWSTRSGSIRDLLEGRPSAALRAPVRNFVQRRSQHRSSPGAVACMTYRAQPAGTIAAAEELVETQEIGFVEMAYASKHVARASPMVEIETGNHGLSGLSGPVEDANDIVCLHAPLRSREGLTLKAATATRLWEQFPDTHKGWHIKRWGRLAEEDRLDEEWAANSHSSGFLHLPRGARPVVPDVALRDAVAPLMPLCVT